MSFASEHVYPVKPRTKASIAAIAQDLREALGIGPTAAVNVLELVEYTLAAVGVYVYPVSDTELPDREADTNPLNNVVRIRKSQFDLLVDGGARARRVRATVAHELGHVILHVAEMRDNALLLTRTSPTARSALKAYEDPEWQAWTFAHAFLICLPTIRRDGFAKWPASRIAATFDVSEDFARQFIGRFEK